MKAREYVRPSEVAEALRLAGQVERSRYICGGTDLVLAAERFDRVIDISRLGLRQIREEAEGVWFGAATTIQDLVDWPRSGELGGGAIRQMAVRFATLPIRNLATLGGNCASAVPSADVPPPFMVLGARARFVTGAGEDREVPLEELFVGVRRTLLEENGLLLGLWVPEPAPGTRSVFLDAARTPGDIVIVNAAVAVTVADGRIQAARLAVGAVYPTPLLVKAAGEALIGAAVGDRAAIAAAAEEVAAAVRPITDHRGTIAYRTAMAQVLVRRALEQALAG